MTVAGAAFTPLGPILSKVAGIGTAFLLNFWLNSTFVFGDRGAGLGAVRREVWRRLSGQGSHP